MIFDLAFTWYWCNPSGHVLRYSRYVLQYVQYISLLVNGISPFHVTHIQPAVRTRVRLWKRFLYASDSHGKRNLYMAFLRVHNVLTEIF